jgi:hypothetical protein
VVAVNDQVPEALLWAAYFFETCSNDECRPDIAVKQLEQITHTLSGLDTNGADQLRAVARRVASENAAAVGLPALVDELLQA